MNNLSIFLNENLNIDVKEYFTLKEEDKIFITKFIVDLYSSNLDQQPELIYMYLSKIKEVINNSIENESYEIADIMNRIHKALDDKYFYYKYFPKED